MKLKGYDVKRLFIRARDDEKYTIEENLIFKLIKEKIQSSYDWKKM